MSIHICYTDAPDVQPSHLLGLIQHADSSLFHTAPVCDQALSIETQLVRLDGPTYEMITSDHPIHSGAHNGISFTESGDYLLAALSLDTRGLDANDTLEAQSENAYEQLLELIQQRGFPHLLRMWNYFPAINSVEAGLERYQQFCVGRHHALSQAHFDTGHYPAASALGSYADKLTIYFLACREAPQAVENPRQVSAYHYPSHYSPKSPSFARAMISPDQQLLLISGTASITGHQSQHHGDVLAQTQETLHNIDALIEQAGSKHQFQADLSAALLKVYLHDPTQLASVKPVINEHFHQALAGVVFLHADVCRAELLIEIEMIIPVSAP